MGARLWIGLWTAAIGGIALLGHEAAASNEAPAVIAATAPADAPIATCQQFASADREPRAHEAGAGEPPASPDEVRAAPEMVAVFGRVLDRSGKPVHGAEVWDEGAGSCCSLHKRCIEETDELGRFCTMLAAGPHTLVARFETLRFARSQPFEVGRAPLVLEAPIILDATQIATRVLSAAGSLALGSRYVVRRLGTAVGDPPAMHRPDDASGDAIEGTTDARGVVEMRVGDGVFALIVTPADAPRGEWAFRVAHGVASLPESVQLPSGGTLVVSVEETRGGMLEVIDADGRARRERVGIRVSVTNMAAGPAAVRWLADDGTVHGDWRAIVPDGGSTSLHLDAARALDVNGQFATRVDGDLCVKLSSDSRLWSGATTVAAGTFRLRLPSPGTYTWQLSTADTWFEGEFRTSGSNLLLSLPTAAVTVTILDGYGGPVACRLRLCRLDPASGAWLLTEPASDSTTTNSRGEVRFTHLQAGEYRVEAMAGDRVIALGDGFGDGLGGGLGDARFVLAAACERHVLFTTMTGAGRRETAPADRAATLPVQARTDR